MLAYKAPVCQKTSEANKQTLVFVDTKQAYRLIDVYYMKAYYTHKS